MESNNKPITFEPNQNVPSQAASSSAAAASAAASAVVPSEAAVGDDMQGINSPSKEDLRNELQEMRDFARNMRQARI